jgi:peptidoglycan/LPS O-acetylase OafA/YrhL
MPAQRQYFPALDPLRAIAFLLVYSAHIGPSSGTAGHIYTWTGPLDLGPIGLNLFFVLSGFLITCLLLAEQQEGQRIQITNFYIRRMLRIWPIYFLIVGISQFLIPVTGLFGLNDFYGIHTPNFLRASICYLLFLPNYAFMAIAPVNPLLAHTWSIGAEEQFYLLWPHVLQKGRRRLEPILWSIIVLAMLSSWIYDYGWSHPTGGGSIWRAVHKTGTAIYWTNMGFFALGGLMAYYRANRPRIVRRLSGPLAQALVLPLSIILIVNGKNLAEGWVPALLFAIIVLQATLPSTLISRAWANSTIPPGLGYWLIPILALAATVVVAALSYHFIERFFLRQRKRFEPVVTQISSHARL